YADGRPRHKAHGAVLSFNFGNTAIDIPAGTIVNSLLTTRIRLGSIDDGVVGAVSQEPLVRCYHGALSGKPGVCREFAGGEQHDRRQRDVSADRSLRVLSASSQRMQHPSCRDRSGAYDGFLVEASGARQS